MGAAGFVLPLKSFPSDIDVEAYGLVWSDVGELLRDRLEQQLKTDIEKELLEVSEELLQWPCEIPSNDGMAFLFADHDVVAAEAGMHWFLAALHTHQADVKELLASHSFVADFSALDLTDDAILAFPTEGKFDALVLDRDRPTEVCITDGEIAVADLTPGAQKVVATALAGGCQCSLCRPL